MVDEPNPTLVTPPNPPQGNDSTARNLDGTIKDVQATPTPDPKLTPTPEKSDTTEAKKDDKETLAAAKDPAKPEDKAAPVVPEKYEFTAPEGFQIDQKVVDEVTPLLKELGVTQEQGQRLFDVVGKHVAESQTALVDFYQNLRDDWRKEIVADKVLGDGKAGLSPDTRQNIAAAIEALPPEIAGQFKDAMNLTGAGDNPAFVRAWNFIGSQFREGKLVPGGKPSPLGQKAPGAGPKSAAAALYPNLATSSGT